MADLNKVVVPFINAQWEDVAFELDYNIPTVKSIKVACQGKPATCCKELFKDWLTTNCGKAPKTWSTLLKAIKEIQDLTSASEKIVEQLHLTN